MLPFEKLSGRQDTRIVGSFTNAMITLRTCLRRQAGTRTFHSTRCNDSFMKAFLKEKDSEVTEPAKPQIETVATCPCATSAVGPAPTGLDIDHISPLLGTMAGHRSQIVVCTGRQAEAWPSKIENDGLGWIARGLKKNLQAGGLLSKYAPAMVTFADYKPVSTASFDFYLFPIFRFVTMTVGDSTREEQVVKQMATILNDEMGGLMDPTLEELREEMEVRSFDCKEFHIMICGHRNRDSRCGELGRPLQREFEEKLLREKIKIHSLRSPFDWEHGVGVGLHGKELEPFSSARVGLISHIGGHKFAGNVVIRVPPYVGHPLSGMEIWYGRVEPKHVEGIVEQTIVHGRIIMELLRGVHGKDGYAVSIDQ